MFGSPPTAAVRPYRFTLTWIEEVPTLPAASVALAFRVWVPSDAFRVFQLQVRVLAVVEHCTAPSTRIFRDLTPKLFDAAALILTVPETVLPLAGLRMVAVGATVSATEVGATVSAAPWVVPLYDPEIVTEVDVLTAVVVTVKLALVAPAATITPDGTEATDGLLLESVTAAPPDGAPALSVTVPVEDWPPVTLAGFRVSEASVVPRVAVRVVLIPAPPNEATILATALSTKELVKAVKVTLDFPAGTVTESGTVTAPGLTFESATAAPPLGAGALSVTVPVELLPGLRPLAGNGAYLLFTLGLIGTGMLGVPVLVGSCAYAVAEGAAWRGSMAQPFRGARKFYAVMAAAMAVGFTLDYVGFNAVKMLFWSAVINGLLAPPLILLVILLTSNPKVMGKHVNPPLLRYLGWATFVVMTAAAAAMIITS